MNKQISIQDIQNTLFKGDYLEIMRKFPDNSVDMVLCDFPYGTIQNKYLEISITWLLTGHGAMFQATNKESTISAQEELIADYRTMPENLKDICSISFKEISKKQ